MQYTISRDITFQGVGLHSGRDVTMTLKPAAVGHGVVFVRTDVSGDNIIPALWNNVVDTTLCTVIANSENSETRVGTIEHVMSALRGCGVDNVLIEVDGPEVPILDGSARPFVEEIEATGLDAQNAPRKVIRVLKDIHVEIDGNRASLSPHEQSVFRGFIDFPHQEIGRQSYEVQLLNGNFKHDIALARTFGFHSDIQYLREKGLARGGSLNNAIVLDDAGIMNEEGLRIEREFIRHKLLDAIGDLYAAGAQIVGIYEGEKAGHALNNSLLHALFADDSAWEYAQV